MRSNLFHSRSVAKLGGVLGLLVVLSGAGTASARPTYPGVIQDTLKGKCPAPCTLCHNTPEGGLGNYKPSDLDGIALPINGSRGQGSFFANMVRVGSNDGLPSDDARLKAALLKLQKTACDPNNAPAGPCDSDGDGTIDTAEFALARDPDEVDKTGSTSCPQYGCGASIGTLPHEAPATGRAAALMALLAAGLVFARRARR